MGISSHTRFARTLSAFLCAACTCLTFAQPTQAPISSEPSTPSVPAAAPRTLSIGDDAPALTSPKWLAGNPVDLPAAPTTDQPQKPGQVTVIAFWSAWSSASREAMSVLGRLQHKFAGNGVRVAAICVWPRDKNEDCSTLVNKWSQRWPVSFAVDTSGDIARKWLDAAGRTTVPMAFVIDKSGKIAWIGSPFEGLATITDRVVKGTLNTDITTRQLSRTARLDEVAGKNMVPAALLLTEELMADDPELFGYLAGFKFRLLLRQFSSPLQAFSFARDAMTTHLKDNPEELNALANAALDHKDRDVSLALDAARRAAKLLDTLNDPDASVLDTLARAQFEHGDADAAAETQAKAVALADEGRMKKTFQKRLDHYKSAADSRVGPPAAAGQ